MAVPTHRDGRLDEFGSKQRPGSLALADTTRNISMRPGSLAMSPNLDSNLNGYNSNKRPGSIAAPINTLGIPPAPARAASHTALHVSHNLSPISQVTSYSVSNLSNNGPQSPYSPYNKGFPNSMQSPISELSPQSPDKSSPRTPSEAFSFGKKYSDVQSPTDSGLVSIIDQVTSGILEDSGSSTHESLSTPCSPDSGSVLTDDNSLGQSNLPTPVQSKGLKNFTQDQPSTGKILAPTPHRPMPHNSETSNKQNKSITSSGIPLSSSSSSRLPTTQSVNNKTGIPSLYNQPRTEVSKNSVPEPKVLTSQVSKTSLDGQPSSRIPLPGSMTRSPSNLTNDSQEEYVSPSQKSSTSSIPTGMVSPGFRTQNTSYSDQTDFTPNKNAKVNHSSGSQIPTNYSRQNSFGYSKQTSIPDDRINHSESGIPSLQKSGSSSSRLAYNSNIPEPTTNIPKFNSKNSFSNKSESKIPGANSQQSITKSMSRTSITNTSIDGGNDTFNSSYESNTSYSENKSESRISHVRQNSNNVNGNTGESRLPTLSSMGRSSSNLSSHHIPSNQSQESKIPTLGSVGRSPSNLSNHSDMNNDSRIPTFGSSGRSLSNLQSKQSYGLSSPQNNMMSPSSQQAINTPGIPPITPTQHPTKFSTGIPTPGKYCYILMEIKS